jgi:hypothetical protein
VLLSSLISSSQVVLLILFYFVVVVQNEMYGLHIFVQPLGLPMLSYLDMRGNNILQAFLGRILPHACKLSCVNLIPFHVLGSSHDYCRLRSKFLKPIRMHHLVTVT